MQTNETEEEEEWICPVIGLEPFLFEPTDVYMVSDANFWPWRQKWKRGECVPSSKKSRSIPNPLTFSWLAKRVGVLWRWGGDLYLASGAQEHHWARSRRKGPCRIVSGLASPAVTITLATVLDLSVILEDKLQLPKIKTNLPLNYFLWKWQ